MQPQLALVPGEPAGIGPELCIRLIQQPRTDCRLLAFADPDTLRAAAAALALPLQLLPEHAQARVPGDLRLRAMPNATPSRFGTADPRNAAAVIDALLAGGQACLDGELDGIVTGPVHKAIINQGGISYSGTTELLAGQAGVKVVMSSHDFHATPAREEIIARLLRQDAMGADVLKIAVMPHDAGDVVTLLDATWQVRQRSSKPLLTMSMGGTGVVSRLAGETFGQALTFGMIGTPSAPGQVEVEQLQSVLQVIHASSQAGR